MTAKHELKLRPQFFEQILTGQKTYEVRQVVDRTFALGDELELREAELTEGEPGFAYTGRSVCVKVNCLTEGITYRGLPAVVMGISYPYVVELTRTGDA